MALEIERRFLVKSELLPDLTKYHAVSITQGYLNQPGGPAVVRVRLITLPDGNQHSLITIKTSVSSGINNEFEYSIPVKDACALLRSTDKLVSKTRYAIPLGDNTIELDIFYNILRGIKIAEIELSSLDEEITLPDFIGKEITHIKGLSNFNMAFDPDGVKKTYNEL